MLSNQKPPPFSENYKQQPLKVFVDQSPNSIYGKMRGNAAADAPNGRVLDRRPSKLEQMRAEYQKKIMKEKEEKMVMMYEENQKKAMDRLMRNDGSPNNGGKSVREFFNERRRLEASGAPVPPIDSHYRKAKGYNSPGGWSSRTGSGNSMKAQKVSAGRDRAHPLAPIRRPMDTQEVANNSQINRSGLPQRQQNGNHEDNPFSDKPRLVKHKPLPPTNGYNDHGEATPQENGHPSFRQTQLKYVSQTAKPPPHQALRQGPPQRQYQNHQQQQQLQQQAGPVIQPRPPANGQPVNKTSGRVQGQQKMTDFQKWQLEQHKAREERLKKLQDKESPHTWDGRFGELPDDEETHHDHDDGDDNENADEDDDDQDDEIARQERELLEKIAKQQAELEKVKHQRQKLEEEEKREQERLKKKEAMDRARQKKLEEEERREEERRRREEEEEMKYEQQREEKHRKEMEKQKKEDEKRKKEEEKLMAKRQKEEEKRMREEEKRMKEEEKRLAKKQGKLSSRSNHTNDYEEQSPMYSQRGLSVQDSSYASSPQKQNGNITDRSIADEHDERPAVAAAASGANYYAQIAKSSDAKGSVGSLGRCRHCGRQFASERLQKHQDACAKVQKPRKEFDSSKKRVEGTEAAKYAGKKKPEPPKKKNNWRAKHEEFIQSLRYAKKVTQIEKEGGDVRSLPPPPTTQNPDLVPCPYCNRTFNETAAERHIPRCKDLKTRPPPMNTRRK